MPPPRREAGLGRPRRVQYDQAQHSRVFVAAHPPAPAPASLWKLGSVGSALAFCVKSVATWI